MPKGGGGYVCQCCAVELNGNAPIISHIQGKAHLKRMKAFAKGCWLCNLPTCDEEHFESAGHSRAMAELASHAVDNKMLYNVNRVAVESLSGGGGGATQAATTGRGVSTPKAPKADADDPTCWQFKNGTCK